MLVPFLSLFSPYFFLFLDFIVISDFVFNKTIILLWLAGYQLTIGSYVSVLHRDMKHAGSL